MLLRTDIWGWTYIKDLLPKTKFIKQADDEAFDELIKASTLPHFSTNMTDTYGNVADVGVHISIRGSEATLTFYITVLTKNKSLLEQLN